MVAGAVVAGVGATEGLLPHAFDEGLGLSGTWALLIGGIALIVTLLVNPEGIAGTAHRKKEEKKRRAAARAMPAGRLATVRQRGGATAPGGRER
jgi:branched-chain amino acid transport system permease protein